MSRGVVMLRGSILHGAAVYAIQAPASWVACDAPGCDRVEIAPVGTEGEYDVAAEANAAHGWTVTAGHDRCEAHS